MQGRTVSVPETKDLRHRGGTRPVSTNEPSRTTRLLAVSVRCLFMGTDGVPDGMTSTTIKVPPELRERVRRHALRRNVSQAAVIEHALDLLDREAFFAQLRRDVAEHPEHADERSERAAWLAEPVVSDEAIG